MKVGKWLGKQSSGNTGRFFCKVFEENEKTSPPVLNYQKSVKWEKSENDLPKMSNFRMKTTPPKKK